MGKRNFTKTSSTSIATLFIYLLQTLFIISNYYTNGKTRDTESGQVLETHSEHLSHKLLVVLVVLLTLSDGALWSDSKLMTIFSFAHPNDGIRISTLSCVGTSDFIFLSLEILEFEKVVASLTHFIHTGHVADHRTLMSLLDVLLMNVGDMVPQHDECSLHILVVGVLERLNLFPALLERHVKLLQIKEVEHMELELQGVSLEDARELLKVEVGIKRFTIDILTLLETLTENLSPGYNLTSPRNTPILGDK